MSGIEKFYVAPKVMITKEKDVKSGVSFDDLEQISEEVYTCEEEILKIEEIKKRNSREVSPGRKIQDSVQEIADALSRGFRSGGQTGINSDDERRSFEGEKVHLEVMSLDDFLDGKEVRTVGKEVDDDFVLL